jgi:hypothetical protein
LHNNPITNGLAILIASNDGTIRGLCGMNTPAAKDAYIGILRNLGAELVGDWYTLAGATQVWQAERACVGQQFQIFGHIDL